MTTASTRKRKTVRKKNDSEDSGSDYEKSQKRTSTKKRGVNKKTKKVSKQPDPAMKKWIESMNKQFKKVDQHKLVDDSKTFFQYVPDQISPVIDQEKVNKLLLENNSSSDSQKDAHNLSLDEIIYQSLNESQNELATSSLPDDLTDSPSAINPSTSTIYSSSSVKVDNELKEKYPSLYKEYLGYCKAIRGIVDPMPFQEFIEQNSF